MVRCKKALASTTVAVALIAGLWVGFGSPAISGGETRTISLYHIHTGESLTVTYMAGGKYVPSALKLSVFPTLLLITTMYRLSLTISTTRLGRQPVSWPRA